MVAEDDVRAPFFIGASVRYNEKESIKKCAKNTSQIYYSPVSHGNAITDNSLFTKYSK